MMLFDTGLILSPVVPAIKSINKGEKMGWFTMPVLFSFLGVAFILGMASWFTWFFMSKMKEQEQESKK